MTFQTKQILRKALSLSPVERAELIERIYSSFNYPKEENFDALWVKEAEARIDAFQKGKLKAISAKKVFQRIKKLK